MVQPEDIVVGVVVLREAVDGPWEETAWRPASVLFPDPATSAWSSLGAQETDELYYVGALKLQLHRNEAASYLDNLSAEKPQLFVVLRRTDGGEHPVALELVTASLTEAYAYGANDDEIIGPVELPEALVPLIAAFVEAHHVEEKFIKRKRRNYMREEPHQFGQEPIFELRQRQNPGKAKGSEGDDR
ncbi:MAG: DUF3305 domain-containing protein [Hyphomicrobiaceae bacterium]